MTKKRATGAEVFGLAAQWEFVETDTDVARELLLFLDDRRVLFGERHLEDERDCVESALQIRDQLHGLLLRAQPHKQLEASMRAIQSACRDFLSAAGRNGERFHQGFVSPGMDPFASALALLRFKVGVHVGLVADFYNTIGLSQELGAIVPKPADDDDAGWLAAQLR